MKRSARKWAGYVGLALLLGSAFGATIDGRVVKVVDGDTVDVLDTKRVRHRVRLGGADAPESGQPYGRASARNLRQLALRRPVTVEWYKFDVHERIVGQVRVAAPEACPGASESCPRDVDVGLAQISEGFAWHYKHYEEEQPLDLRHRYALAERSARAKRLGLWRMRRPMPPWDWRHPPARR